MMETKLLNFLCVISVTFCFILAYVVIVGIVEKPDNDKLEQVLMCKPLENGAMKCEFKDEKR